MWACEMPLQPEEDTGAGGAGSLKETHGPTSSLSPAFFSSTQKSPICHYPLKVFVRNCKILRLMPFGTNIAINIDIPVVL
jgi:hypothetical protein